MTPPTIPFDFGELGNRLARSLEFQRLLDDAELVRNLVDALDWIANSDNKRVRMVPIITDDGRHLLEVMIEE